MKAPTQKKRSIRRIAFVIIAVAFVGLLGFFILSWRPAIAPIERPSSASFSHDLVAKGELLVPLVKAHSSAA